MKKRFEFTSSELMYFDKIRDDLILYLFETKDKRYAILEALKEAYIMGHKAGVKKR